MENNKHITWSQVTLLIVILGGILGIVWNTISNVQTDVVLIRVDAKETRTMLDALISRINNGSLTFKIR